MNEPKEFIMSKIERIVLYPLLGLLFVLAMIFDLQITQGLFMPDNWFGMACECLAECPLYLLGATVACIVALYHPRPKKVGWHYFIVGFFFIGAAGASLYGGYHTNSLIMRAFHLNYGTLPKLAIIFGIAIVNFAASFCIAKFLIKPDQEKEAFLLSVFVLTLVAGSLLLMQALKMIWLRPRYRTLMALQEAGALADPLSYWKALWQPQFFTSFKKYDVGGEYGFTQDQINAAMNTLGVTKWAKEEFYSFPSGHTMNSFLLIALCYAPRLFPKTKDNARLALGIRIAVYVIVALIAFSRILRGAHNATDVIGGYILALVLFDLLSHFFYERFLRQRILPKLSA